MTTRTLPLFAALLTAILLTCESVPEYCGNGVVYNPDCDFCYGSKAYRMCLNDKGKTYNPLVQGCVPEAEVVGTLCANGIAVPTGTPCGGYTLTAAVTPEGAGKLDPPPQKTSFAANERLFLNAIPTSADYEFAGWGGTAASQTNTLDYTMAGSNPQVLIVAIFKPTAAGKLITDAVPKNAGTVSRNTIKETYAKGDQVTLTATPAAGNEFDGWSGADESKTNPLTVTMNESKTLVAIFKPATHNLKAFADPHNGGAIFINGTPVAHGSEIAVGKSATAWAKADEGFKFLRWVASGGATITDTDQYAWVAIAKDGAAITAVFDLKDGGQMDSPLAPGTDPPGTDPGTDPGTPGDGDGDTSNTTTPVEYSVTVSGGDGATGGGNYAAGDTVNITAGTPPDGQAFKNWTTASAGVTFADSSKAATTFIMPANAVTVTANFETVSTDKPTYTVTVIGAKGATGGGTYYAGMAINITAGTDSTGQKFKNWTTASDGVSFANANSAETSFDMPENNVTVTAVFDNAPTYTVTVSSAGTGATGGGTFVAGKTISISAGTAPEGQKFKNWTTNSGVTFASSTSATTTFTMPANVVTVTAVFETVSSEGCDYDEAFCPGFKSSAEVVSAPADTIYNDRVIHCVFIKGMPPDDKSNSSHLDIGSDDIKINGLTGKQFHYNNNALNSSPKKDGGYYIYIPATGSYHYLQIKGALTGAPECNNGGGGGTDTTNTNPVVPAGYTITFNLNYGTTAPTTAKTNADNKLDSLPSPTRTSYTFDGWYNVSAATGGTKITTGTIFTSDATIYARWAQQTVTPAKFTLTTNVAPTGSGTVSPAAATVDSGSTVTVTAASADGYRFTGWSGASSSIANPVSINMIANRMLTANFERVTVTPTTFTITFNPNGGSVATSSADTRSDSTLASLPTPTRSGNYEFSGWYTAATGGTQVTTSIKFTANATIYAHWTDNSTGGGSIDTGRFTDKRDSKSYKTTTIGGVKWMAENLNYSTDSSWCYRNSPDSCAKYGSLYNWDAAQTACPDGWHLPSRDEWGALAKAAGGAGNFGKDGTAGNALKSTSGWYKNGNSTDTYGFSALPGGDRYSDGHFDFAGLYGIWWTATGYSDGNAYNRDMYYDGGNVGETYIDKSNAFSVRCVGN